MTTSTPLRFTKGQGTGNDFVLVTDAEGALALGAADVAALCDRRFGVGADGILRAVRASALDEPSAREAAEAGAEWFMDYRNADGSIAEMCGNGIRVFTAYLVAEGLIESPVAAPVAIGTRAGVKSVRAHADGYVADLGLWRSEEDETLVAAPGLDVPRPGLGVDLGNPHVVVALASYGELEGLDLGREPRLEPHPQAGANVEFVVPGDPLVADGVGRIRMRVHERGSGETLSCGTGAVAAALATRLWAGEGAPDRWRVAVPGGVLGVEMVPASDGEHVLLSGPAVLAFEGAFAL